MNPLLRLAIIHGLPDSVRGALLAGADPDEGGKDGNTPLLLAVRGGNAAICRILLEAGADPGVGGTDGRTALDLARTEKNDEVRILLESWCPTDRGNSDGRVAETTENAAAALQAFIDTVVWTPEAPIEQPTPVDERRRAEMTARLAAMGRHRPPRTGKAWLDDSLPLTDFARDSAVGDTVVAASPEEGSSDE